MSWSTEKRGWTPGHSLGSKTRGANRRPNIRVKIQVGMEGKICMSGCVPGETWVPGAVLAAGASSLQRVKRAEAPAILQMNFYFISLFVYLFSSFLFFFKFIFLPHFWLWHKAGASGVPSVVLNAGASSPQRVRHAGTTTMCQSKNIFLKNIIHFNMYATSKIYSNIYTV